MYRDKKRYGQDPKSVYRSSDATFYAPLKKKKFGPLVFTCSWSDFFIAKADEWRSDAWDVIKKTPHLTYQILTKRSENIASRLPSDWGDGYDNVWLGVSVESPEYLKRVEELATIPAKVRFISYEPALEFVDFQDHLIYVDWLISGGESGPKHRKANIDWFRKTRDACVNAGVKYFHKQHGGNTKTDAYGVRQKGDNRHLNKSWGGRILDGEIWSEMPDHEVKNV